MEKMDNTRRAKQFVPFDALEGHMDSIKTAEKKEILYDETTQEAVPVIVSFGRQGGMIPLYFMVDGVQLKISKVIWQSNNKTWGNQYRCEAILNERIWTVDLFYYSNYRMWTMKKM